MSKPRWCWDPTNTCFKYTHFKKAVMLILLTFGLNFLGSCNVLIKSIECNNKRPINTSVFLQSSPFVFFVYLKTQTLWIMQINFSTFLPFKSHLILQACIFCFMASVSLIIVSAFNKVVQQKINGHVARPLCACAKGDFFRIRHVI